MTVSGARTLKEGENEMVFTFTSPDVGGVKLVKTYTMRRGAYDMAVRMRSPTPAAAPVSPQLYLQLVRDGNKPAGESSFYSTFTGPAVYTEAKKYQKVDFADIKKNKADYEKQSSRRLYRHGAALLCQRLDLARRCAAQHFDGCGGHRLAGARLLLPRDHDRADRADCAGRHQGDRCQVLCRSAGRKDARSR